MKKKIKLNDNYVAYPQGRRIAVHIADCDIEGCPHHEAVVTRSQIQRVLDGKIVELKCGILGYMRKAQASGKNAAVGCQVFPLAKVKKLLTLFPKESIS